MKCSTVFFALTVPPNHYLNFQEDRIRFILWRCKYLRCRRCWLTSLACIGITCNDDIKLNIWYYQWDCHGKHTHNSHKTRIEFQSQFTLNTFCSVEVDNGRFGWTCESSQEKAFTANYERSTIVSVQRWYQKTEKSNIEFVQAMSQVLLMMPKF